MEAGRVKATPELNMEGGSRRRKPGRIRFRRIGDRERATGTSGENGAPGARMRRCLKLRQGASPLRPPAPFPAHSIVGKESSTSRVRYDGLSAALDFFTFLPEDRSADYGKGGPCQRWLCCLPLVGPEEGLFIGELFVYLTFNGLLMEGRKERKGKERWKMQGCYFSEIFSNSMR